MGNTQTKAIDEEQAAKDTKHLEEINQNDIDELQLQIDEINENNKLKISAKGDLDFKIQKIDLELTSVDGKIKKIKKLKEQEAELKEEKKKIKERKDPLDIESKEIETALKKDAKKILELEKKIDKIKNR